MNQKHPKPNYSPLLNAPRTDGRSIIGIIVWLVLVTVTSLQGQTENPAVPVPSAKATAAQPSDPLFVVAKRPVTVPVMSDGKQIGSVMAPAGSKFEVVSRKEGKLTLKHQSGGMVEVSSGDVLGTDLRQLPGVWEFGKKIWFYEFRVDGTVVRTGLTYPLNNPVPFGVKIDEFKAVTTIEKIVITLDPGWGYLELKVPFDLEKPQFVFFREENGKYTPRPFPLIKSSPEEVSARVAAERVLAARRAEKSAGENTVISPPVSSVSADAPVNLKSEPVAESKQAEGISRELPPYILWDKKPLPTSTGSPRKILVLGGSSNYHEKVTEWMLMVPILKQAGHDIRFTVSPETHERVSNDRGSYWKIKVEYKDKSDLFVKNPNPADYDVVVAKGGDSDIPLSIRRAIEKGKLVVLMDEIPPWEYGRAEYTERISAAEKYLQGYDKLGFLVHNEWTSLWSGSPVSPKVTPQHKQHGSGGGFAKIRVGDVVQFKNVICYNLSGSEANYDNYHYVPDFKKLSSKGVDGGQTWDSDYLRFFVKNYLAPCIINALSTHDPAAYQVQTKTYSQVEGIPKRPNELKKLPMHRPSREGKVIVWGFKEGFPGNASDLPGKFWKTFVIPPNTKAVQISLGGGNNATGFHCLALQKDGSVQAWGDNSKGQCNVPPGLKDIVQVSASEGFSAALSSSGEVTVWGDPKTVAAIPDNISGIVQIIATEMRLVMLTNEGTPLIYPAGPDRLKGLKEIKDLVAVSAERGGFGLKIDGTVVSLSTENEGPEKRPRNDVPEGLGEVVAIATNSGGGSSMTVLHPDGSLSGWGRNDAGQVEFPQEIPPVKAFTQGRDNGAAIHLDGSISLWGSNWSGQLEIPDEYKNARFLDIAPGSEFYVGILE